MGKSINRRIHECLCNNNKSDLLAIADSNDFVSANMDIDIYVELIQFRWDAATVMRFAQLADDDQLATVIATSILQAHAVRLGPLFALLKDAPATIRKHQLAPLFLVACDHEDLDAVQTLIEYKCYDPKDPRPLLTVVRKEAARSRPHTELVTAVLKSHPGLSSAATFALDEWVAKAKNEQIREMLTESLQAYLGK